MEIPDRNVAETHGATRLPEKERKNSRKLTPIWRAVVEVGFIIFLFYSNLLMGEFEHAGSGQGKSLIFAIKDIFTATNFVIAIISALIGYVVVEYLRDKL